MEYCLDTQFLLKLNPPTDGGPPLVFVLNLLDGPPNVLTGPCWKPPPVLKVLNDLCEVVVTGPRVKDVLLKLPE